MLSIQNRYFFMLNNIELISVQYKFRNGKDGHSYLVLDTNDWNRLKKQSNPPEKPLNAQKEYVKSLNETSRAWTKTWPDHEHGLLVNYEKKRKSRHDAQEAIVKADREKQKLDLQNINLEAIKEAKQKIFDTSCYGNKLLSALLESKTLEERDAQIQFLKEIKEKEAIENKKYKISASCSLELDKYEVEEEKCRKSKTIKLALQNKAMYEKQKADATKAKEAQIQGDLEDKQAMRKMLDLEQKAEERVKLLQNEAMEEYIVADKKAKEQRAKSVADYNAKVLKCQKEKEEISCKINHVVKEMSKATERPWMKLVYENLSNQLEEKRKHEDRLMEINYKLGNFRADKRERKNKEKEIRDHEKRLLVADANKLLAKERKYTQPSNKCSCDRQSLIVTSEGSRVKKKEVEDCKEKPPPHFGPCNKLMSALKKRMHQPSPWTGVAAAHQQFARNADEMLRECKYKNTGRKVVDEYIKYNKLESLDVPNYY